MSLSYSSYHTFLSSLTSLPCLRFQHLPLVSLVLRKHGSVAHVLDHLVVAAVIVVVVVVVVIVVMTVDMTTLE
jgi:hypothetical protein